MMIPEFMRFYGYTAKQTLGEYAITFFSLVNSMYRLQAREQLRQIVAVSAGMNGKESQSTISEIEKQEKGLHGIVQEIRNVK
jgi:hypothetical protein